MSTLRISTRWRSPIDRSRTVAAGIDRQPEALDGVRDPARASALRSKRRPCSRQRERHVLGDGERRHEAQVLEHHADAVRPGDGRRGDRDRLAVDRDRALVGRVHARRSPSSASTCRRRSRRARRGPRRGWIVRSTSSLATSVPKRLVMPGLHQRFPTRRRSSSMSSVGRASRQHADDGHADALLDDGHRVAEVLA